MTMTLHGFYRSSASYRVRIALNLKGAAYDQVSYKLRAQEQRSEQFLRLNPQGLVPALEADAGVFTQSLAIMEYLDEVYPEPPLLPAGAKARARVRALAGWIACDIHPLNNLRVLKYLRDHFEQDDGGVERWVQHWIGTEFTGLERKLASDDETGRFMHGDRPTIADVCLVPQIYNAQRFNCDMDLYPTLKRIDAACAKLTAFKDAHPDKQPDAG